VRASKGKPPKNVEVHVRCYSCFFYTNWCPRER